MAFAVALGRGANFRLLNPDPNVSSQSVRGMVVGDRQISQSQPKD